MPQCLNHLCGPLLNYLQYFYVSLVLGSTELDPEAHLTHAQQRWRTSSLNLLAMLFLMQSKRLLAFFAARTHSRLMVNLLFARTLRACYAKVLSSHSAPSPYWCKELFLPKGRTWEFPFAELHENPVRPFLQLVELPPNGSTTLCCSSQSSHFCIICKLLESALCPIVQVINEDVNQHWPQYWPLGYTTNGWLVSSWTWCCWS